MRMELAKTPVHSALEHTTADRIIQSGYTVKNVSAEIQKAALPEVQLPRGYGVIGGAARSIAFQTLRGGEALYVRDIDLVCTSYADKELASDLAQKYNPDDFDYGHGVQEINDMNDYFESRDFTMNQLAVIDGSLLITDEASKDIKDGIIRLTAFERRENTVPSDRMILKALLLESALSSEGIDVHIATEDQAVFKERNVTNAFWLALMLQKSLEYGQDVAKEYWEKITNQGILDAFGESMKRAAVSGDWIHLASEIEPYIYGFGYRGKALDATTNHELLSEFMWSQDDSAFEQDPIEDQRSKLEDYSGKGSNYLDPRYGAW